MSGFTVIQESVYNVRRFNVRGRKVEFKINPTPTYVEPVGWVKGAVKDIVEYVIKELRPTDKVGITFGGKCFEERGPGWMNFRDVSDVNMEDIWEMISKIFQSNSEGLRTDSFRLGVTSVRLPQGRGNNRRNKYNTFNEECARRKGIIAIKNNDGLCLPRALVVAIAKVEKDRNFARVRKDMAKIQTQKTKDLINKLNITIPVEGAGISELRKFQDYLKDYKISVYQYGTKGRDLIFEGVGGGKRLNLLYHKGHYNVITSTTAAFCCSFIVKSAMYST